jgi:hypothetical protein
MLSAMATCIPGFYQSWLVFEIKIVKYSKVQNNMPYLGN